MKLTNEQLKQIIKEELEAVMDETLASYATDHMRQAEKDTPRYSVKAVEGNTKGEIAIYIKHPGGVPYLVGKTRDKGIVSRWQQADEQNLIDYLEKRKEDVVGYVDPKTGGDAYGGKPPPQSGTFSEE